MSFASSGSYLLCVSVHIIIVVRETCIDSYMYIGWDDVLNRVIHKIPLL